MIRPLPARRPACPIVAERLHECNRTGYASEWNGDPITSPLPASNSLAPIGTSARQASHIPRLSRAGRCLKVDPSMEASGHVSGSDLVQGPALAQHIAQYSGPSLAPLTVPRIRSACDFAGCREWAWRYPGPTACHARECHARTTPTFAGIPAFSLHSRQNRRNFRNPIPLGRSPGALSRRADAAPSPVVTDRQYTVPGIENMWHFPRQGPPDTDLGRPNRRRKTLASPRGYIHAAPLPRALPAASSRHDVAFR